MVTSPLYQPSALAAVVGVPVRLGAVLSMLMPVTEPLAELSALSTAEPFTDWFAPSVETTTLPPPVQVLTPDRASTQVTVTVTPGLFQPAALGAGAQLPLMVGFVLSSFTSTEPLPVLPSLSVAVAVLVTPPVSELTVSVAGLGPVPTPEPESVADHVTVTLLLFQPAALRAGATVPATTGPVLSRVYDGWIDTDWPGQTPFELNFSEATTVTAWAPSPAPAVVVNVQVDW